MPLLVGNIRSISFARGDSGSRRKPSSASGRKGFPSPFPPNAHGGGGSVTSTFVSHVANDPLDKAIPALAEGNRPKVGRRRFQEEEFTECESNFWCGGGSPGGGEAGPASERERGETRQGVSGPAEVGGGARDTFTAQRIAAHGPHAILHPLVAGRGVGRGQTTTRPTAKPGCP
jgi:hypothetical protein